MWPINSAVTSTIVQDDFFAQVEKVKNQRFYPRLSQPKTVQEITTTFESFGSVPEIRQLSGVSGGGVRQPIALKDWTVSATMFEWEQTVPLRRIVAVSKPDVVRAKTQQLASKAMKGMDRTFCQALVSANAGYDGQALLSTAHPESGTSQSNLVTGANITTNFVPTAVEAEAMLQSAVSGLKAFQDDQGTPVNEGAERYLVLCPLPMWIPFKRITDASMSSQSVDSSGGTGVYRGQVDIIASAYATTTGLPGGVLDRIFVFIPPSDTDGSALALATLADWQFNTNINDEGSDDWNAGWGFLRSWAAFAYVPWNWSSIMCHIVT